MLLSYLSPPTNIGHGKGMGLTRGHFPPHHCMRCENQSQKIPGKIHNTNSLEQQQPSFDMVMVAVGLPVLRDTLYNLRTMEMLEMVT